MKTLLHPFIVRWLYFSAIVVLSEPSLGVVCVAQERVGTLNSQPSTLNPLRLDPKTPEALRAMFKPSSQPLPFVSAHRGGPCNGYPENCIATFEHTIGVTRAILEIDPRFTADAFVVIHHDATLERTTTGKGPVNKQNLADLRQLKLKDTEGTTTNFGIPTLDEVLEWARGKTILVLDQKDVPTAERVKKITEHRAESFAMIIANTFKDAWECHRLNPNVMMEIMVPNLEKAEQFDKLGIPWTHVVAFVGHVPPEDLSLYRYIHSKGASCMVGSSRNVDRKWIEGKVDDMSVLEPEYRTMLGRGADIIETDIPTNLGPLLFGKQ